MNQERMALPRCRICDGTVRALLDFGRQPVSNAFLAPSEIDGEVFFHLAVGMCTSCTMVQQLEEVSRGRMFHPNYPYRSSSSAYMRKHFQQAAQRFLETELIGPDAFAVEIGSNDGIMLETINRSGVRHLGVDPSTEAAEVARAKGIRARIDFFEESSASDILASDGPATLIYSANTISHIAYIDSIFRGVDLLLARDGVFVIEDRYLGDIMSHNYFDQIYDEHFFLFAVRSLQAAAVRYGFELVDVEHLPVHGGAVRYTVARPGSRRPAAAIEEFLTRERLQGLATEDTFLQFATNVGAIRDELVALLRQLRAEGRRVVGYGATSRSATVMNYCGIGPELVPFICDSTPEKQDRLAPGSHVPVREPGAFHPYPDYALLFAWNHAEEIMAKERRFREAGGRWILYVPDVRIV